MQNQLYRHRCLHDSLEDSSTIFSLLLKRLVICTALLCFGRDEEATEKECWCVGGIPHRWWFWLNNFDRLIDYLSRRWLLLIIVLLDMIVSPSSTHNQPHHIQAAEWEVALHSLQLDRISFMSERFSVPVATLRDTAPLFFLCSTA